MKQPNSVMTPPETMTAKPDIRPARPLPPSTTLRIKFFLTGVVMPIITFIAIGFGNSPSANSPWQSGHWDDYLTVFLSAPTIFVFSPFLIYSMICMSVWCFRLETGRHWYIRLGLQTGVLLASLLTAMLMMLTALIPTFLALFAAGGLAIIVAFFKFLVRRQFSIAYLLVVTTLVALAISSIPLLFPDLNDSSPLMVLASVAGTVGLFIIGGSSTLCIVTYLRATFHTSFEADGKSKTLYSAWAVWIVGCATSAKFAVDMMFVEYAKLPTTNPNCYVSSAAAHGHQNVVGVIHKLPNGAVVNRQMQTLKAGELVFQHFCPTFHKYLRVAYNRIGPILANQCQRNIWLADASFVLLKPIEVTCGLILNLIGVDRRRVSQIYL